MRRRFVMLSKVLFLVLLIASLALSGCTSPDDKAAQDGLEEVRAAIQANDLQEAYESASTLKEQYEESSATAEAVALVSDACVVAAEEAEEAGDVVAAQTYYGYVIELAEPGRDLSDIEARRSTCQTLEKARSLLLYAQRDPQYADKFGYYAQVLNECPETTETVVAAAGISEILGKYVEDIGRGIDYLHTCAKEEKQPADAPEYLTAFLDGGSGDDLRAMSEELASGTHPDGATLAKAAVSLAKACDEGCRWEDAEYFDELGAAADAAAPHLKDAQKILKQIDSKQ